MLKKLIPHALKNWFRNQVAGIAREATPKPFLTFLPARSGARSYLLPKLARCPENGVEFPVPPQTLWCGYAQGIVAEYLRVGKLDCDNMLNTLARAGTPIRQGQRILDFGCASGRMIRHLKGIAETSEVWGVDISADHIIWDKEHLTPPFKFATTTTTPHLPFPDGFFDVIYAGSVFTHIDDMVDSWLLEIKRILKPTGCFYCTIHDNRTIAILETSEQSHWLSKLLQNSLEYREHKADLGMLVVGRGIDSQVFYDRAYFIELLANTFEVVAVDEEAYRFQTALLTRPKEDKSY